MERTLDIGPLALPWSLLLPMLAWIVGSALHERLARRTGLGPGTRHSWLLMACMLLAARTGYVLYFPDEYGRAPWSILDLRDGGWAPWWGVAAAVTYVVFLWAARSPWRRTASAGAAMALVLWVSGNAWLHPSPPSLEEQAATALPELPSWRLTALDGAALDLQDLKGRPTVVNFWATWCPPCRREMPVLLQASRQAPDVRFIWVNQGEERDKAARYAAQQGLPPAGVLLDADSDLGRLLGLRALPTTLFYDARGRLVASRIGELSAATLAERLRLATRGRPGGAE